MGSPLEKGTTEDKNDRLETIKVLLVAIVKAYITHEHTHTHTAHQTWREKECHSLSRNSGVCSLFLPAGRPAPAAVIMINIKIQMRHILMFTTFLGRRKAG